MKPILCLTAAVLLLAGCSTDNTILQHLPVEQTVYDSKVKSNRQVKVYRNKATGKKLNGYFSIEGPHSKKVAHYQKGLVTGRENYYVKDTLKGVYNYNSGLLEGVSVDYYPQDSVVSNYSNGLHNGIETHYYNGRAVRTTQWKDGIKTGREEYFNPKGEVSAAVTYELKPFAEKGLESFEIPDYLAEHLKVDRFKNFATNEFMQDSVSLEWIGSVYKYAGEIVASGWIDINAYPTAANEGDYTYAHPNWETFTGLGIGLDVVSPTLQILLQNKEYRDSVGLFYIVNLNMTEVDALYYQQWIVYFTKDSYNATCSTRIR